MKRLMSIAQRLLGSKLLRWAFMAVVLAACVYGVAQDWGDISRALLRIGAPAAVISLVTVLAGVGALMLTWRRLLAGLGSPLPLAAACRIFYVGQLGKYLPGSVWPLLVQMELGRQHKVPRNRSASAWVLAMLLWLLTALLAALVMLPFTDQTDYMWAFAAAPFLLACLHPRVLNLLLARVLALTRQPPLEQPLTGRVLAGALGWGFVAWACFGLQIWVLAIRLGAPPASGLLLSIGGYAFAWAVGLVVVIAPGGLGIRDVLLVTILTPVIGSGNASAVALVSRLLNTAADLLAAGVSFAYRRPGASLAPAGPDDAVNPDDAADPAGAADEAGAASSPVQQAW